MAKDLNQARALDALLECASLSEAAAKAGITRRQLFNYLHHDAEFLQAYQQRRRQMAIERAEALARERQGALDAITSVMNDGGQPGTVRLNAAKLLLAEIANAEKLADDVVKETTFERVWQ